jgi:hypothetical protein
LSIDHDLKRLRNRIAISTIENHAAYSVAHFVSLSGSDYRAVPAIPAMCQYSAEVVGRSRPFVVAKQVFVAV